jgi:hypothetical protein
MGRGGAVSVAAAAVDDVALQSLAVAVLRDRTSPPVLMLAAFRCVCFGDFDGLREMVVEAAAR